MSMMIDKDAKVAFEAAIRQIVTLSTMVRRIAKALVTSEAIMALVARLLARLTRKVGSKVSQQFVVIVPLSPPPLFNSLSFFKNHEKKKRPKKDLSKKKKS